MSHVPTEYVPFLISAGFYTNIAEQGLSGMASRPRPLRRLPRWKNDEGLEKQGDRLEPRIAGLELVGLYLPIRTVCFALQPGVYMFIGLSGYPLCIILHESCTAGHQVDLIIVSRCISACSEQPLKTYSTNQHTTIMGSIPHRRSHLGISSIVQCSY